MTPDGPAGPIRGKIIRGEPMRLGSFMPVNSIWKPLLASLQERFPGHEILAGPEAAQAALPSLDGILAGRLDRALFESAISLQALFVPFTGLNHLPADLLLERGVKVYNVHGQAPGVAERALALALAFYGRVVEFHNDLSRAHWHGFWAGRGAKDQWESLYGRPCAIFGTGAIGTALAGLLKAFHCPVTGCRRRGDAPVPPGFDRIETDLRRAVAEAELLFIALPLTPATRGLFSRELLLSARGKFLVNVGRGPIVDEEGLYLALRDGVLKGAGIDTWYTYPVGQDLDGAPSSFPIHHLPNVILSPHVGGSTTEGVRIAALETMENLAQWLQTGTCGRQADLAEMY
jgi:phosphoglycerate dehydrogenase-like enzyme